MPAQSIIEHSDSGVARHRVLVLNRNWQAVNIVGVRRAFSLLCQDHARVINTRDSDFAPMDAAEWIAYSQEVEPSNPQAFYLHDGLGSVRTLTNASGFLFARDDRLDTAPAHPAGQPPVGGDDGPRPRLGRGRLLDPDDRRALRVVLTEEGIGLRARLQELHARALVDWLDTRPGDMTEIAERTHRIAGSAAAFGHPVEQSQLLPARPAVTP